MKFLTSGLMPVRSTFLLGLFFGAATANAAIEIAKTPLQTGSSVPPNIMFIIDDSGSMHLELMPEDLRTNSGNNGINDSIGPTYMFPRLAKGIYGGGDNSTNNVPSFRFGDDAESDDERITAAMYRSSAINKVYYNPAVTYKPWANATGTGPYVKLNGEGNVDPKKSYAHPLRTDKGSRDFTQEETASASWVVCTSEVAGADGCKISEVGARTFFPAVYYYHKGGAVWDKTNYEQVEIRPTVASYSGHGRAARTDCNGGVCTYAQEIQNFANWHTYHRSRLLTSKAGIGSAFSKQSPKMRVGFGTLNKGNEKIDGVDTSVIVRGVRDFDGSNRNNFFSELYGRTYPFSGTPLRKALDAAGKYYSRTDSLGPWGLKPGTGSESPDDHIVCRQSFTILMTDGYWSGGAPDGVNNEDNAPGDTILRPEGDSGEDYTYSPVDPFADEVSTTLADVAMKYWKKDLRPKLPNRVPTSSINPAFWQHMVTFGVGLGVSGSVTPEVAFAAIGPKKSVDWKSPFTGTQTEQNRAKINDLLHAAVNSRGGFFTADKPDDFANKLDRTLSAIIDRVASASNLAGTTTSVQADNFVYQGSFNSGEWSGSLQSFNIKDVATPVWKSNFPKWDSRNIVFGKTNGVAAAFTPANVLADNNALSDKADLVDYLRGNQTLETGPAAKFRKRASLMGDIANSSPLYVAAPVNRNYQRYNWDGASKYRSFLTANADRTPVVYVGANDGMLHAFNGKTGKEIMAYVPQKMLTEGADLASFADTEYQHKYYVDGSPVVFDAYIDSAWRSILLGSLGRGGNSLFAVDVSSPAGLMSGGAAKVMWDKSYPELGVTTNKPVIARLTNGKWVAIAGYGYNNSSNKAGLLVIDLKNGDVLKKLETDSLSPNGVGQVEGWDANGDGNMDWFFAGDITGNIWKFDLSSTNPSDWAVAYNGKPLFTAVDADGDAQAITGGISLSSQPDTGHLWVFFGTGKMLSTEDPLLSEPNSWYGIRDGEVIDGREDLKSRSIIAQQDNARVIEPGSADDMAGKRGWYIDLDDARERIVNRPQLVGNSLVVNTITPGDNDCNPQGSGWVMSVSPYTGGRLSYLFFDRNRDGKVNSDDALVVDEQPVPVTGVRFDGMPSEPVFFDDKMIVGLADTRISDITVSPGVLRGRVSWRELTNQ